MGKNLSNEDVIPISGFRANVSWFIEKVRKTKRPLVITQHGKNVAVIMDVTEYEALLEKLEVLTDIQIAQSQVKQGQGLSHEDAKNIVLGRIQI